MSKFNKVQKPNMEKSYEGGLVYEKNPLEDWMNFLFSSYLEDRFYEDANTQLKRFQKLTSEIGEQYGWEFVAKAAFFARNELGMRSASEFVAAMLNNKKFDNKRAFYRNYFHRPDGVSEVFAAIDMLGDKRSHALVRGAGDYLSSLGSYQIGKYKMSGKTYNMFDLINITHANSHVIDDYKQNCLETPDTWETAISGAKDKEDRQSNWRRLVEDKKLGYMALIRNIRNIVNADVDQEWVNEYLIPQIENEEAIRKSLVFPYQIYCAWKNIGVSNFSIEAALDKAFKISCSNIPKLEGNSVVFLDVSGSMEDLISRKSTLTIKEVGAVYAAALLVANNADFIKFGTYAKKQDFNPLSNIFNIIQKMEDNDNCGYGTDISRAFKEIANKKYDRIFIISDMQVMDISNRYYYRCEEGALSYKEYCIKHGRTKCYSFDLGNYSTQVANPNNPDVYLLTSLTDKLFKVMPFLENGSSLYDYIEKNFNYA